MRGVGDMTTRKYESPSLEVQIERAYRDRIGRFGPLTVFSLRHVVVYNGDGHFDDRFGDLMIDAREQGIIGQQEWDEAWSIQTVLRGKDRQDGSVVFGVVDVAFNVEDHHINKAAARADILRRVTGERANAAVIGAFISDGSLRELAHRRGVYLEYASLEDAKLYRYFREDVLEEIGRGKSTL